MQVNILFSGLCLFVPKPASAGSAQGNMHVLLPAHHHGGEADRHAAALRFDTAHLRRGAGGPDTIFAQVRLRDYAFVLGKDYAEMKLCPQIVDLRPVTGSGVDPLDVETVKKIVSRVTLGTGGMVKVAPGHCWKWEPEGTRPLAHQVLWTADWQDGPLDITLQNLRKAETRVVTLYPIGGIINLEVHHVPHGQLPLDPPQQDSPPPAETQPPHFRAFYNLFSPDIPVVLPRYKGPLKDCKPQEGACDVITESGGSPFTCMVAGVTPP